MRTNNRPHSVAYTLAQATWGLPQTLVGAGLFLAHARRPHFRYHGAVVTTWESRKAVSLGLFVFLQGPDGAGVSAGDVDGRLLAPEYGHTIQSLILGPLYLPVTGLPSAMWLNVPAFARRRARTGTSYYTFYTERWANTLADKFLEKGTSLDA